MFYFGEDEEWILVTVFLLQWAERRVGWGGVGEGEGRGLVLVNTQVFGPFLGLAAQLAPPLPPLPCTSSLLPRSLVASLDVLECVVCTKNLFASQLFLHFSHKNGDTATDELITATNVFS